MNEKLTTLILVFCINAIALKSELSAGMAGKTILPDGYILRGVEGKLFRQDANGVWLFEFDSAVSDGKGRVDVGARLELLPSSALERMIADVNDRSTASYELWAKVTKYKSNNFILPIYFLPLNKVKSQPPSTLQQSQEKAKPTIGDPNGELAIPQEILDKLRNRRTVRLQQPERSKARKQDAVLANRTGFIRDSGHGTLVSATRLGEAQSRSQKGEAVAGRGTMYGVFVLDALGRNIQSAGGGLRLLPCQALELTEWEQSAGPDPIRFRIAGIVTEYRGQKYLLLQQATRVYSHGNFGR